jgi:hypothetical protein
LAKVTGIFEVDLQDALKEREILVYNANLAAWCFDWKKIQETVVKAKYTKEKRDNYFAAMTPEERKKKQIAIRYAIPTLIRWTPFTKPTTLITLQQQQMVTQTQAVGAAALPPRRQHGTSVAAQSFYQQFNDDDDSRRKSTSNPTRRGAPPGPRSTTPLNQNSNSRTRSSTNH